MKNIFVKKEIQKNLILQFLQLYEKHKGDKPFIRNLEMRLLRPAPLPEYKLKAKPKSEDQKKSIIVRFAKSKYVENWGKHFKVNYYLKNNTHDTDFLIELFRLFDTGKLAWNSEDKKFYLNDKVIK